MRNNKRIIKQILILTLVALILAGCGGALAEPTTTPTSIPATSTPTTAPPTSTPTAVPPTSTPTAVPPTSTPTTVPPTPTSTPKMFVITDDAFRHEDCQSDAVIEIRNVQDGSFSIGVREGGLPIRNNRMTIWCEGIEHVWLGKLTYESHTFDSSVDDPLRFLLVADGYKYVGGTGTVILPDGTTVTFP